MIMQQLYLRKPVSLPAGSWTSTGTLGSNKGTASSITVTFGRSAAVGEFLVACVSFSGGTIYGFTDASGNVWTRDNEYWHSGIFTTTVTTAINSVTFAFASGSYTIVANVHAFTKGGTVYGTVTATSDQIGSDPFPTMNGTKTAGVDTLLIRTTHLRDLSWGFNPTVTSGWTMMKYDYTSGFHLYCEFMIANGSTALIASNPTTPESNYYATRTIIASYKY